MSEWTENFENDIKTQIEGVKRLDVGYINVRLLNNTAKKIDKFYDNCKSCKRYKSDYNSLLPNLVEKVKESSFRDEYENKLIEVVKHLEKKHKILPKSYFASLYTFFGILTGLALGILIAYFINKDTILTGLFWGGFGGIIIGRLFGLSKDKRLSKLGLSI